MDPYPDGQAATMPEVIDIATIFGPVHLIWTQSQSGPKVRRIVLPHDLPTSVAAFEDAPRDGELPDDSIRALIAGIRSFLQGNDVRFDIDLLDLDRCPLFQRRVLLAEFGIPRGYVSTYGRIARYLDTPGAARAVGNALARNPFPLVIPCHRVLRSDGRVGGFQAGLAMKRRLLEMEGVGFREDGRAILERIWY